MESASTIGNGAKSTPCINENACKVVVIAITGLAAVVALCSGLGLANVPVFSSLPKAVYLPTFVASAIVLTGSVIALRILGCGKKEIAPKDLDADSATSTVCHSEDGRSRRSATPPPAGEDGRDPAAIDSEDSPGSGDIRNVVPRGSATPISDSTSSGSQTPPVAPPQAFADDQPPAGAVSPVPTPAAGPLQQPDFETPAGEAPAAEAASPIAEGSIYFKLQSRLNLGMDMGLRGAWSTLRQVLEVNNATEAELEKVTDELFGRFSQCVTHADKKAVVCEIFAGRDLATLDGLEKLGKT